MSRLQRRILPQNSVCLNILRQVRYTVFVQVAVWNTASSLPGAVSVRKVPARRLRPRTEPGLCR